MLCMKTSILLLALTLTACGPDFNGAFHVKTTCMEQVYSKIYLNPTHMQRNIDLARDTFVWMGLSKSDKAFCDEFKDQVVIVQDIDNWNDLLGKDIEAQYDLFAGIKLGRWGRDLLHELFHAVDVGRYQAVGSAWHGGWDTNGYNALSHWYMMNSDDLTWP
jgi:hypothetical protein